MSRGLISFPVVVVFLVIGFLYYTTVFVVVDDWLGLRTSPGILNAGAFTALASMVVFSYLLAITKDPGSVPSTFVPDVEDSESPIHEIKRKGGDLRYCQKCSHYKPPRAHHCRVCKRCVLRMDHHCVWINNCVGHGNYKAFFVFVLYAVIACIHAMVMLLSAVTHDVNKDQQLGGGSSRTLYILCGTILVPLTVALSILLGWHIYLVFHNKTTIEYHEGVRAMWLAEKVGHIYRHPYDLGVYENLVSATLLEVAVCKIYLPKVERCRALFTGNVMFSVEDDGFHLQISNDVCLGSVVSSPFMSTSPTPSPSPSSLRREVMY